ncbi:MAG: hypothetical protein AB8C02_12795 [Halioglobus sp.]
MAIIDRVASAYHLRRAKNLSQGGDITTAIGHLLSANEHMADPALERDIIDQLLQTIEKQPTAPVPQAVPNPSSSSTALCKLGELPEVTAAQFSAKVLNDAIAQAGHLIVRGMFSSEDTQTLKDCIDEAMLSRFNSTKRAPGETDPWYHLSPYFPGKHDAYDQNIHKKSYAMTGSMKVLDSPRGTCKVLDVYRKYKLREVLDEYFGEPTVIATRKWVFRLVKAVEQKQESIGGGWHQDGQFMGGDVRAMNLWVPLNNCGSGTDSPGMALLPKRLDKIQDFGTRGAKLNWVVGPELVQELAEDAPIVYPHFEAGDALFFDHLSLH